MLHSVFKHVLRSRWSSPSFQICLRKRTFSSQTEDYEGEHISLGSKDGQKIYEIRTYDLIPQYHKTFYKMVEENLHLRTRHSNVFGFWSTELGAINESIHFWEYDNHEHRSKVRKAIAADAEWQNNFIQKILPMISSQTNATVALLPWSKLESPKQSGVYELQVFNMNSHNDIWDIPLKAAMELSSSKLQKFNSVLIGCFTTIFGHHNTVYILWQHENFDRFVSGKLHFLNDADKAILHAFHNEVLTGFSKGLLPLKVSPLQ